MTPCDESKYNGFWEATACKNEVPSVLPFYVKGNISNVDINDHHTALGKFRNLSYKELEESEYSKLILTIEHLYSETQHEIIQGWMFAGACYGVSHYNMSIIIIKKPATLETFKLEDIVFYKNYYKC